jgi:glycogen debranching enzyme
MYFFTPTDHAMNRLPHVLLIVLLVLSGAGARASAEPVILDRLGIPVKKQPRQFVATNKEAGTYYSEALAQNAGGWFGWFVNAEKIMHDYDVIIGGRRADRATAAVTVYPDRTVRTYRDGTVETFAMVDGLNALTIDVAGKKDIDLRLELPDRFVVEPNTVAPYRSWKRSSGGGNDAVPSSIVCVPYRTAGGVVFIISASSSLDKAMRLADSVFLQKDRLAAARRERIESILRRAAISADDARLTKAFAWAVLSMDALIMRQAVSGVPTTGIFAGLPWFNNYWGRDSFISLPGATYVTGNFIDAREILRSYARFQERDTASTNYGRIPNLATPTSVQYNTADGTPWFVKGVDEYVDASNDTAFYREMYPVVLRSIEGTLRYHTDSLYFLTHADAETWMDAVGPDGPWSPRGNRANDIQALWYDQLRCAAVIAAAVGDTAHTTEWAAIASALSHNFTHAFLDTAHGLAYDHLTAHGIPSQELRPNQLFCLALLPNDSVGRVMTTTVLSRLVYEHGTGTLAQTDSNFTPYHHYEPYYVQDAAYHNGIVWTWLNGAAIQAAARYSLQDVVYPVTQNMVHQILDRGCVGALSELLDAHPRKGEKEPRLSGTYSQAWSLAEFIRSMYQDYLGARVEAYGSHIQLTPRLPKAINDVSFPLTTPEGMFTVRYVRKGPGITVRITSQAHADYAIGISLLYDDGYEAAMATKIAAMSTVELRRVKNQLVETHDGAIIPSEAPWMNRWIKKSAPATRSAAPVHLAVPRLMPYLKLLKGPSYPMLPVSAAGRKNPSAAFLFEKDDPAGDDRGPGGTYTYPGSALLKPGSLDITHAAVRYDAHNVYFALTFKNLSDPGWHPEYGFQLTLAAIAIHRGACSTQTAVGVNSHMTLASAYAYDRLLIVGGGYRLTDGSGTVLCEYRPRPDDAKHPIGSVRDKTIEFSVPVEYIGTPAPEWKMTILVGAQDDHGGAGVGEFRAVDAHGGEWTGGGKTDPALPNVFDVLVLDR